MSLRDAIEHMQSFAGHTSSTITKEYNVGTTAVGGPDAAFFNGYYAALGVEDRQFGLAGVAARTERIWCFYARFFVPGSTINYLLRAMEGTTIHGNLAIDTAGHLIAQRNGTTLATSTQVVQSGVVYWVCVRINVHDTTGKFEVRLTGGGFMNEVFLNFTGDVRNAGTGIQDRWQFGQSSSGVQAGAPIDVAHLYVLNGDHADAAFLPPSLVESRWVDSDGDVNDGTPSTGTDHYALVDENPGYNEADYVDLPNVGNEELYTVPTGLTGGTIHGVAVVAHAAKTDAGDCAIRNQAKAAGGTIVQGPDRGLSTTSLMYYDQLPDVPGGTGWGDSDVNDLQVGVDRTL